MRKAISMPYEEVHEIEVLFYKYLSYMNMLQFLASEGAATTEIYDKKWEEASKMWIELDALKRAAEDKYKPEGYWDSYEFDFEHMQVVFVRNGTDV